MKEFLMLFRSEEKENQEMSPEEMQAMVKTWEDWIGGIAAQGKFVSTNALEFAGKVVHADKTVTDGPYTELKEIVGGYILVKADDIDDAVKLSEGCPIFASGGKVEVRGIMLFS